MRFKHLNDWLQWQEGLHGSIIDLGLKRVAEVWRRLQPEPVRFKLITVAGTNGKGSTVVMLEQILCRAGISVGAYTSPHLIHYNERIRLQSQQAGDQSIMNAFDAVDQARGNITLTYFEFGTLAALYFFQQTGVDVALLEVGLGGRLDAVNILDADIAVITPIDMDHQAWLGDDRDQIAREKAGILRPGQPVVCSDPHPPEGLMERIARLHCQSYCIDRDYQAVLDTGADWRWCHGGHCEHLPRPAMAGTFQLNNAAAVRMVVQLMRDGGFGISKQAVAEGLAQAQCPGRFQRLAYGKGEMILDVAHNAMAATALAGELEAISARKLAVFGVMADKDIKAIVHPLLASIDTWYPAAVDIPRAANPKDVADLITAMGARVAAPSGYADVHQALMTARRQAHTGDCIVVFGSFYVVAAVLAERQTS